MDKFNFYDDLASQSPETIEVDGHVLMNKNKHKWHLCKSSAGPRSKVRHACGSSGPSDPNRSRYAHGSFQRNAEVATPEESVEYDRVCTNCLRVIEKEFPVERLVIAVSHEDSIDLAVEKFAERRNEIVK